MRDINEDHRHHNAANFRWMGMILLSNLDVDKYHDWVVGRKILGHCISFESYFINFRI